MKGLITNKPVAFARKILIGQLFSFYKAKSTIDVRENYTKLNTDSYDAALMTRKFFSISKVDEVMLDLVSCGELPESVAEKIRHSLKDEE